MALRHFGARGTEGAEVEGEQGAEVDPADGDVRAVGLGLQEQLPMAGARVLMYALR